MLLQWSLIISERFNNMHGRVQFHKFNLRFKQLKKLKLSTLLINEWISRTYQLWPNKISYMELEVSMAN